MLTGTFGLMSQRSGPFLHPIIKRIEPYRRTKCRAAAERIKDAVKEDVQGSPQVPDVAVLRSSTFESTGAFESPREIGDVKDVDEPSGLQALWNKLSGKEKIIVATFLSFIICNMDKVNMSVAIIPIAQDFGWSSSVSGLVQSAFFYGYMLCQMPSGFLSTKFTGSRMLPIGVGTWSLATMGVPVLGSNLAGLCISRASVGLGEAMSPSATTDIVARTVPKEERARAMATVFGGLNVGTILGLLLAPIFIENFGWQSVFYAFGGIGLVWVVFFENLVSELRKTEPEFVDAMRGTAAGKMDKDGADEAVPWRAMFRCRPLQALMFTHFCNNWFHFTMLAWLPSYFVDTLSLDLTHASQLALIPPVIGIMVAAFVGPTADSLIKGGWSVSTVRKLAQCIAFLGPLACLSTASISDDGMTKVICIAAALGLSNFSLAGLYCNHQDLSPKYASAMLGITNTVGALPGIAGVTIAGWLLDQTGSWTTSLFLPSMLFFVSGAIVYGMYGSGEAQDLSDNEPFQIEGEIKAFCDKYFSISLGKLLKQEDKTM